MGLRTRDANYRPSVLARSAGVKGGYAIASGIRSLVRVTATMPSSSSNSTPFINHPADSPAPSAGTSAMKRFCQARSFSGHHFGITFCVLKSSSLSTPVHLIAVLCALNTVTCRDILGQEWTFVDTERQSIQQIRNQQVTGSNPVVGSIVSIYKSATCKSVYVSRFHLRKTLRASLWHHFLHSL